MPWFFIQLRWINPFLSVLPNQPALRSFLRGTSINQACAMKLPGTRDQCVLAKAFGAQRLVTAIDREIGSGDKGGVVAQEEQHGGCDLDRLAHPTHDAKVAPDRLEFR